MSLAAPLAAQEEAAAPPPPAKAAAMPPPVSAQMIAEPPLQAGEVFHTRFSGMVPDENGRPVIDIVGIVGSAYDVSNPGRLDGRHWLKKSQRMFVTAAQVGQVFGIAIDDANPPNIYLAATSAYGLHRSRNGWMPGMWGPGGGPGTIWKLNGANNYQPEIFARVELDGRPNSGAALGNIAWDPAHRQLFVSDLETGMIHRFSADGRELGRFDHGVQGRADFFNAVTGRREALPPVAFDPQGAARVRNCRRGKFSRTPACWNYADFRRRVYGLAVRTGEDGKTRLYYSVWGSAAFGNPQWKRAGADKANSVWSVGLSADGGFDPSDVRKEFVLPAFFIPGAERPGQGPSHAVTDLAFPKGRPQNRMAVAERGMVRNLGLGKKAPFAWPHESRVLLYRLGADGRWRIAGRYDVGFRERREPPRLRANAAGGVDFGYGYKNGALDLNMPDGILWASGDSLCSPRGACFDPSAGARTDVSQVHGMTGMPADLVGEPDPAAAHQTTPGDVAEPDGPMKSVMIDSDITIDPDGKPVSEELSRDDATLPGDVEAYQLRTGKGGGITPPSGFGDILPPPPPPDLPPPPPPPPSLHGLAESHNRYASSGHYTAWSWHVASRSWHYRTRSWHRVSLSWHYRARSWHYRWASWHTSDRSWHYRLGSWHSASRSWHVRNRSWHNADRSWHSARRSWHRTSLSWHRRDRSWHFRARSWHDAGWSWHKVGRSWHNSDVSWHVRNRSWHVKSLSWHRKGVSYHDRGASQHAQNRSWHRPLLSWHVSGRSFHKARRSWHVKNKSWHVKGRTFHLKPRSWHVTGLSWGQQQGHVMGKTFHQRGRSWHVKGKTFHLKPRSWHVTGLSWEQQQGHVRGKTFHQRGRSWHRKGKTFHLKPRSWHVTGLSWEQQQGHVRGKTFHQRGRSWHRKGKTFHLKPRSWHRKGLSWGQQQQGHVRGKTFHQRGRSWHRKGKTFHLKPRSWHRKGLSWGQQQQGHVKGRSFHRRGRSWRRGGGNLQGQQRRGSGSRFGAHEKGRTFHLKQRSIYAVP